MFFSCDDCVVQFLTCWTIKCCALCTPKSVQLFGMAAAVGFEVLLFQLAVALSNVPDMAGFPESHFAQGLCLTG